MAAVFLACLVFAILRLGVEWTTGKDTPWWGNALGAAVIAVLYAWYRSEPEKRSEIAVHGTALAATIALLIPTCYGMPSSKWWLTLVGFAVLLMGRRREALFWAPATALLIVTATLAEPYVTLPNAVGEPPSERAAAAFFFVLILFGITAAFRRVADRRAAKLSETAASLERSNRVRNRFLAHMSHEIRTPLHGVIAMTDLALATELSEESRSHVESAYESAQVLLTLLNNLLDVTRVEADAVQLAEVPFDLHFELARTLRPFQAKARAKGLTFEMVAEPDVPERRIGDRVRLMQIVLNIVSNAVKFTDEGHVTVRLARDPQDADRITIQVADTGRGISAEEHETIFLPFRQARTDDTRFESGAGVGLAIAHALTRLMDGTIEVDSEPDNGAVFTVSLHIARAPQTESVGPADLAKIPVSIRRPPLSKTKPLRILVCEDEAMNRRAVRRMLKLMGHHVVVVEDGRSAWEKIQRGRFGVLLTDMEMPHMNGFELIARIRQAETDGELSRLPIVATTAHVGKGELHRLTDAGADAHLAKPFTAKALEEAIATVVAKSGSGIYVRDAI